ncbi:MAG TPA: hypothetical protein ENO27_02820 [Caldithrix sp.]|nr:hypothetical protein [Calditrichaceae bacterium]HEM49123.1 hypothetical protein [Caldithrix sp.]
MGKLSNSWELMKASWKILMLDKEMLLFPLFSGIASILVMFSFAAPLFFFDDGALFNDMVSSENQLVQYVVVFLFYFCNYFVVIFFNSAVIICATIRMNGGDPTVKDGIRLALKRLPLIIRWALVASGVGMLLRIIEERAGLLGRIIAGVLGFAWTVTSFLVIPVMVVDKRGPIDALKESAHLLRKTWGEQLITNFSFGLIFLLLMIPAFGLSFLAVMSGESFIIIFILIISMLYFLILLLIQSTLQGIFQAALFKFARSGNVAEGFNGYLLKNAIRPK